MMRTNFDKKCISSSSTLEKDEEDMVKVYQLIPSDLIKSSNKNYIKDGSP